MLTVASRQRCLHPTNGKWPSSLLLMSATSEPLSCCKTGSLLSFKVLFFFLPWFRGAIGGSAIKPRIKLAGDIFEVNKRRSAYMQLLDHKFHPFFPLDYERGVQVVASDKTEAMKKNPIFRSPPDVIVLGPCAHMLKKHGERACLSGSARDFCTLDHPDIVAWSGLKTFLPSVLHHQSDVLPSGSRDRLWLHAENELWEPRQVHGSWARFNLLVFRPKWLWAKRCDRRGH